MDRRLIANVKCLCVSHFQYLSKVLIYLLVNVLNVSQWNALQQQCIRVKSYC